VHLRSERSAHAENAGYGRFWAGLLGASRLLMLRLCEDSTLVQGARAGNPAAFDALETRYRERIGELTLATLGNAQDAARAARRSFVTARRDVSAPGAATSTREWLFEHALRAAFAVSKKDSGGGTVGNGSHDPAAMRHRMTRAAHFLNERRAQRMW